MKVPPRLPPSSSLFLFVVRGHHLPAHLSGNVVAVKMGGCGTWPWSSLVNNTHYYTNRSAKGADNDRCPLIANKAEFNGPSSSANVHAGRPIRSLLMRPRRGSKTLRRRATLKDAFPSSSSLFFLSWTHSSRCFRAMYS